MPRKRTIRTTAGSYHVTARVNHRHNFPIELEECWPIFLKLQRKVADELQADIHAFVLMSNHYHMLLSTPQRNIDTIMKYFNREATREISLKSGLENHIFGARYRWSVLYGPRHFSHVFKYVMRNPVKAGIVTRVENYPFSSVRSLMRPQEYRYISIPEPIRSLSRELLFDWLNDPTPKEEEEVLKKSLRRKEFQFPRRSKISFRMPVLDTLPN